MISGHSQLDYKKYKRRGGGGWAKRAFDVKNYISNGLRLTIKKNLTLNPSPKNQRKIAKHTHCTVYANLWFLAKITIIELKLIIHF